MMRGKRSAKFAEYTATYAILKRLGLHDTILIEKRDASVGYGVFVKDACDAGTSLIVIPSRRACSISTINKLGANLQTLQYNNCKDEIQILNNTGVISNILGCSTMQWANLAWLLAIEKQRALSPWWGWLNILPNSQLFKIMEENCERQCRLHHTKLLPYFKDARNRIKQEVHMMYHILAEKNVAPSLDIFNLALNIILSRVQYLPSCWKNSKKKEEEETIELGIMPFIDLINGDDGIYRKRNARVEIAFTVKELPDWYRTWFIQESELKGMDGEKELYYLMEEHFFAIVVLEKDLTASEEVILQYELLPWNTGILAPQEELLLGRFLRYLF